MINQKELQNLLKNAEKVKEVTISKGSLKKVDFEGFKAHIGNIFECDKHLYARSQKSPNLWLKTRISETPKEKEDVLKGLIKQNQSLAKWCQDFKKHIDEELKTLESRQEEILKEVKEYVDNKTSSQKE